MNTKKSAMGMNIDRQTVESFGEEWENYNQISLNPDELEEFFDCYFHIFPWETLPPDAIGFDAGCGSGRWAKMVSPRVGGLNCIDASERALETARLALSHTSNVIFYHASVDAIPLEESSQDFGFSLGVLHHVPDTQAALSSCVKLLKPGAPFLLYLYYNFDNRPAWYKFIWQASNFFRLRISQMSPRAKRITTEAIAALVYWPMARLAWSVEKCGIDPSNMPLSFYRNSTFYSMRTDSRDRFGTPLEQRFSKDTIKKMMEDSGLENIVFSDRVPYWVATGCRCAE